MYGLDLKGKRVAIYARYSSANQREASIEDAVRRAAQIAEPGDVVLLAPGCSSHDQFANFEERGRRFRDAARALTGEGVR